MKVNEILDVMESMFPNAHCELIHDSHFQLAVAVVLSAQTTDARVNSETPALFAKYPTAQTMREAPIKDIEFLIRKIGLFRNKAVSIKGLANELMERFDGVMPNTMDELLMLPGVGRKTANVILSVCFDIPAIAVDTHVERVSKRLKFAKMEDNVLEVEKKLMKKIPKYRWNKSHHLMIFFGRYFCKAKNPNCTECPFTMQCRYFKERDRKYEKSINI